MSVGIVKVGPDDWGLVATLPWPRGACRSQEPINCGCADAQELSTDYVVELEVAMTLERRDEEGEEWPEALPADSIRCFPEHDQGLAHGLVVQAHSRHGAWLLDHSLTPKHPNGVLSMTPGQPDKLIEDTCLVGLA